MNSINRNGTRIKEHKFLCCETNLPLTRSLFSNLTTQTSAEIREKKESSKWSSRSIYSFLDKGAINSFIIWRKSNKNKMLLANF